MLHLLGSSRERKFWYDVLKAVIEYLPCWITMVPRLESYQPSPPPLNGELPCSGGERRILQLSASLAGGIPVDLRDAVTGLDGRNTILLVNAIRQAAGRRRSPRRALRMPT
jgi:hypothetical protein